MTASPKSDSPDRNDRSILTRRFRLLGLLPLAFFTSHFLFYWTAPFYADNRGIDNMLWMCNAGNVVLGLGILLGQARMIRLATLWLIPGLPLWLFEVVQHGGWLVTSFLTHIGALIVGLIAMRRVRADRWSWVVALAWYLAMQLLSRWITSPYWNVNVAHRIYSGYETIVNDYWLFWLITTAMVAMGLWVLGVILYFVYPAGRPRLLLSRTDLGLAGLMVGALGGFLVSPGSLPISHVIARGAVLQGSNKSTAELAFKYLVAGAVLGLAIGVILAWWLFRKKADDSPADGRP